MHRNDNSQNLVVQIPNDILKQIADSKITLTPFEEKNAILLDTDLQHEIGYRRFPDGSYLVSMTCPMPKVTSDMIAWWFWWHPQANLRYQIWFPGEHYCISYDKKNKDYFEKKNLPAFQPNTQYPTEKISNIPMSLRIDFVSPEEFGFSEQAMKNNRIPIIICGHVSAFHGLIPHTEMSHIFQQTEDGLFLTSRFWIGKTLRNRLLRKVILTEKTARSMAEHCCIEYRNLARLLPELYHENCEIIIGAIPD